jgi:hypothetical protein
MVDSSILAAFLTMPLACYAIGIVCHIWHNLAYNIVLKIKKPF